MNRIIALWAHPRCMSTVMLRVMIERGDFTTFLEPFAYVYYVHDAKAEPKHLKIDPDHPKSYAEVKAWLLEAAQTGPVFFKDMSYYVLDYLADDPEFVRRLDNSFIVRDPAPSIASYYAVDPDVRRDEIGHEHLCRHFELVVALGGGAVPPVIAAEDLRDDPQGTVAAYCAALGLDFRPEALHWRPEKPRQFKDWNQWVDEVSHSTGIERKPDEHPVTVDDDPRLKAYEAHHRPYYEVLRRHRLAPKRAG